jgi:hypothetical protein
MDYFCFCSNKNDLKVTRVTNPNIPFAVVKRFGLEGESFLSERACLFLGYTPHFLRY